MVQSSTFSNGGAHDASQNINILRGKVPFLKYWVISPEFRNFSILIGIDFIFWNDSEISEYLATLWMLLGDWLVILCPDDPSCCYTCLHQHDCIKLHQTLYDQDLTNMSNTHDGLRRDGKSWNIGFKRVYTPKTLSDKTSCRMLFDGSLTGVDRA